MDLEGNNMLKVYLEKFEDFSDKLLRVLKPYARGLAQVIQDFRLCRIGNRDKTHFKGASDWFRASESSL